MVYVTHINYFDLSTIIPKVIKVIKVMLTHSTMGHHLVTNKVRFFSWQWTMEILDVNRYNAYFLGNTSYITNIFWCVKLVADGHPTSWESHITIPQGLYIASWRRGVICYRSTFYSQFSWDFHGDSHCYRSFAKLFFL